MCSGFLDVVFIDDGFEDDFEEFFYIVNIKIYVMIFDVIVLVSFEI